MSNVCLIAASLVAQGRAPGWELAISQSTLTSHLPVATSTAVSRLCNVTPRSIALQPGLAETGIARAEVQQPEFSSGVRTIASRVSSTLATRRPTSGSQLYAQRVAALRAGTLYTRVPPNSFQEVWANATRQPTHEEWVNLLDQEARSVGRGQGSNRLTVLLGDSLALWFPPEAMAQNGLVLNQGISGDTTRGVLRRLNTLAQTRPDTIHVMVGINDLRLGASDDQVLNNMRQIIHQLRAQHPQARIFVHSILPTRLAAIPANRVRWLNYNIAAITRQEKAQYLDLQSAFADASGNLQRALTTDGLHLSRQGYKIWQLAMATAR